MTHRRDKRKVIKQQIRDILHENKGHTRISLGDPSLPPFAGLQSDTPTADAATERISGNAEQGAQKEALTNSVPTPPPSPACLCSYLNYETRNAISNVHCPSFELRAREKEQKLGLRIPLPSFSQIFLTLLIVVVVLRRFLRGLLPGGGGLRKFPLSTNSTRLLLITF